MGTESKRILVIQTAYLGDVVLTTPLLRAIRDQFPSAFLAALVIPGTKDILHPNAIIDAVFTYDKKGRDAGIRGLVSTARFLKKHQFDLCFLPHRSFRSALLAWLSRIPVRIGFSQSPGAIFYNRRIGWRESQHEVFRCLELLKPMGIDPETQSARLWVSSDRKAEVGVKALFEKLGIRVNDRIIGVAPGSVWPTKRWIPEGFSNVIDVLIKQHAMKVLLLGSVDDIPTVDQVMAGCKEKPINLSGKTTLGELAEILKRCSLLITNDNGSLHVGAAQDIPIVAIYGPTNLSLGYGPFSKKASIVEKALDCRPCGLNGHKTCPLDHFKCMRELHPNDVLNAIKSRLNLR